MPVRTTDLATAHKRISALIDLMSRSRELFRTLPDDLRKTFSSLCFDRLYIDAQDPDSPEIAEARHTAHIAPIKDFLDDHRNCTQKPPGNKEPRTPHKGAQGSNRPSLVDLVANAVAHELRAQRESLGELPPGRAGLELLVREYLSPQHRDDPGHGCPSAALLDEITRGTDATRQAYTDGALAFIDDFAAYLAPDDPQLAHAKALSIYAAMIGTMQMSRALADRELADEILDQGIRNVLTLVHAEDVGPESDNP